MIRMLVACACAFALVGTAVAQAPAQRPDPRTIQLRGNRFKPLKYDEMTPAQKAMVEHLIAGPRGGVNGPFNVLLRSPEIGDLGQEFGGAARFKSSLPQRLYELAILVTARHWTAQYEWQAHHRSALQAGLSAAICDAIAAGRRPASMQKDEEAVYDFVSQLLNTKQVSDAAFSAAKNAFGEKGVVDIIAVTGWYSIVSMMLNVDQYPVADGTQPELKPINVTR
ncbi:MAG TPA: carboxymuconolactone decarboxylase family protein [Vicinamibacterales bacterium]|nr:carboxymuconolactone decarboxylase family protein [Vicinamibacterales bacterium]